MGVRYGWALASLLTLGGAIAMQPLFAAPATLSTADRHFMTEAAAGGMAEVKLGELAAQKSTNADVQAFGKRMVTDHSKANNELMGLAKEKGVKLPGEVGATHKKTISMLAAMNGAGFDRAYMSDMVKDHTEDVAAFEKEANQGTDPAVKAWAAKTLPTLQEHLKMAKDVASKVGTKASP